MALQILYQNPVLLQIDKLDLVLHRNVQRKMTIYEQTEGRRDKKLNEDSQKVEVRRSLEKINSGVLLESPETNREKCSHRIKLGSLVLVRLKMSRGMLGKEPP